MTADSNPYFIGMIEGFYGPKWSWSDRLEICQFLKIHNYKFYIYAPKADSRLRKNWLEEWSEYDVSGLQILKQTCLQNNLKFGIGFSPFEVFNNYNENVKRELLNKVEYISKTFQPDIFCLLFDDMRGDLPELAKAQVKICKDVEAVCSAERIIVCPTYYTTSSILEELFGKMPANYLAELGAGLSPRVDVFWTGPDICSREYSTEHLDWVTQQLGRKPFIWDNYPVNDDKRMSPFIHLNPFENRNEHLKSMLAGHAINPMMQCWLSRIPLASIWSSLNLASDSLVNKIKIRNKLITDCCGEALGNAVIDDINIFTEIGSTKLSVTDKETLFNRYKKFDSNPYAREILSWLKGDFLFSESWLD